MTAKPSELGSSPTSGQVVVSVRPEKIQVSLTQPSDQVNWFEGRLQNVMYLGTHVHYLVKLQSGDLITVMQPNRDGSLAHADAPIYVYWTFADCLALAA